MMMFGFELSAVMLAGMEPEGMTPEEFSANRQYNPEFVCFLMKRLTWRDLFRAIAACY